MEIILNILIFVIFYIIGLAIGTLLFNKFNKRL